MTYTQQPQWSNLLVGSSFVFFLQLSCYMYFLFVFSVGYYVIFLTGNSSNCHLSCRPKSPRRGVAVADKGETDYALGRTYGPSFPCLDDQRLSCTRIVGAGTLIYVQRTTSLLLFTSWFGLFASFTIVCFLDCPLLDNWFAYSLN